MTTQKHNSRQPDGLDEAFELVSREIDGDLSDVESTRLAAIESESPRVIADFRKRCLGLQAVLCQIPARPVGKLLFRAPIQTKPPGGAWDRHRKGVVWGSITVVIAACLLLATVRPWNSRSADADRAIAFNAKLASPEASLDSVGILNQPLEHSAAAGTPAVGQIAESSSAPGAGSDPAIQPLLESEDWNIIVVKLDVQDRELAMQRIQSIVQDRGLRLQNSAGDVQSDFLGVVATSAIAENDALVSEMEKSITDSPVERDSRIMAEARRQEIIADVRRSLQSPTQSELHHGQVYLALSTGAGGVGSTTGAALALSSAASAGNAAEADRTVASARDSSRKSDDAEGVGGSHAVPSNASITLIVFEFRSAGGTSSGESSGKQI